MTALYQKYRPKTFAEVFSQNHIKITLQNEIVQGAVGHAYLFYGPRAVGKTTTARLLAKAVNCENRKEEESEPCNACSSCLDIANDRSLDVVEIDAASNTGVDNVRENIIANVRVVASKSKNKVYIIDEVHMLSISAFNALLKTLEEPPKNVIFILATTEIHKVPSTIISRCQRFDFKRVSNIEMMERLKLLVRLEEKHLDEDVIISIVREAGGYVRDAESLLGQVLSLDEKNITKEQASIVIPPSNFNLVAEFVEYLINKDSARAIEKINDLVEESIDLVPFSKDLIVFLRKLLLSKISNSLDNFSMDLNSDIEEKIVSMKEKVDIHFLTKALNIFIIQSKELSRSNIVQLPLEMGIVELIESTLVSNSVQNQNIKVFANNVFSENIEKSSEKKFNFASKIAEKVVAVVDDVTGKRKVENVDVAFEQVQEKWPKVLDYVQKKEASIFFMLTAAQPIALNDNVLTICFKHKFHYESMQNGKLDKMESILSDIFKVKLYVKCECDLTMEIDPVKVAPAISEESSDLKNIDEAQDGELKDVLNMFGGKVVE